MATRHNSATLTLLSVLLVSASLLHAADAPPVKVFIAHPALVTDVSKEADFMAAYLKRWAKSEILLVDTPDVAQLTVEILHTDTEAGAGTARTSRGVFGGIETRKDNVYTTTAKLCLKEECTELTKERLKLPDAIKKFVKDNAKAFK